MHGARARQLPGMNGATSMAAFDIGCPEASNACTTHMLVPQAGGAGSASSTARRTWPSTDLVESAAVHATTRGSLRQVTVSGAPVEPRALLAPTATPTCQLWSDALMGGPLRTRACVLTFAEEPGAAPASQKLARGRLVTADAGTPALALVDAVVRAWCSRGVREDPARLRRGRKKRTPPPSCVGATRMGLFHGHVGREARAGTAADTLRNRSR